MASGARRGPSWLTALAAIAVMDGMTRTIRRFSSGIQSIVGDTILAVARDSFDVQRVQVLVLSE